MPMSQPSPLNPAQQQAVHSDAPYNLILAGAGSGKTRVLIHRLAYLLETQHLYSQELLAVTFTNKAAAEMRLRTELLLKRPCGNLWMGTFHGIAHRILRKHWDVAQLPQSFQIIDSDDQIRIIRRLLTAMDFNEKEFSPRQVQWFINHHKENGQRAQNITSDDFLQEKNRQVYQEYDQYCRRLGLVDFAELLLRTHELLVENPALLQHYQQRFKHILVDEFQDTNTLQNTWLRLLAGDQGQLFVVGDDDQSIYGWRGARYENIQDFTRDYPAVQIIRLEQNYRSTGRILAAANALIAHNTRRLGKELWTEHPQGEAITVYNAINELDEARFVMGYIEQLIQTEINLAEIALLYRSNAQSRVLEDALISRGIPYRIYGGLRFFDRAEIKDVLAYVRLAANPLDDASFERIVNVPARGIGEKSLAKIRDLAKTRQCSLWQAIGSAQTLLPPRTYQSLSQFVAFIEVIKEKLLSEKLREIFQYAMTASQLLSHYQKEGQEKILNREENLQELLNACDQFYARYDPEEGDVVTAFIAHSALDAQGENLDQKAVDPSKCVQLMTLHSAKGLEFQVVFLCGLEEGLFPHKLSLEEAGLEEERRLCYVGITRAKQRLFLSYANQRRLHGNDQFAVPSRFLREIPAHLLDWPQAPKNPHRYPHTVAGKEKTELDLGQRVNHPEFGEGLIIDYEGSGRFLRVEVNFVLHGRKWLILEYAPLEILD